MLLEYPTAVPMLYPRIPKDHTAVHVNLDVLETDGCAEVETTIWLCFVVFLIYFATPYNVRPLGCR